MSGTEFIYMPTSSVDGNSIVSVFESAYEINSITVSSSAVTSGQTIDGSGSIGNNNGSIEQPAPVLTVTGYATILSPEVMQRLDGLA